MRTYTWPFPWKVWVSTDDHIYIQDAEEQGVALVLEGEKLAEFIVAACNNFGYLAEACEEALGFLKSSIQYYPADLANALQDATDRAKKVRAI